MAFLRKMILIDEEKCTGCGLCVPGCAEGALQVVDGKARLVGDIYCDGLGACIGECPEGALIIEEREAEDFDPQAVLELLGEQGRSVPEHMPDPKSLRIKKSFPAKCPGAEIKSMTSCQQVNTAAAQGLTSNSNLSHWPVQLRLVPSEASFLQGADLLLTADCVPVALPDYHANYIEGKVVVMGCPKFDDAQSYIEKMASIISQNEIQSITVMEMEVPCCSSMSSIVRQALLKAGRIVQVTRLIISRDGRVLSCGPLNELKRGKKPILPME